MFGMSKPALGAGMVRMIMLCHPSVLMMMRCHQVDIPP